MGQMYFPKLTLRQAGERLKQIVAGNPGPKDHLRLSEACGTTNSLDEALARVAAETEFQVDVDDAACFIRNAMNGKLPLSAAEVEALSPDSESNSEEASQPKGASRLGM